MNTPRSRRLILTEVGRGMIVASVGAEVVAQLGVARAAEAAEPPVLHLGELEPLVCLMQETPPEKLLPLLQSRRQAGASLRELTAAAALANARSFGGEDYVGFHTMMALSPALAMADELPSKHQALPVCKVIYRNSNRIQESGRRAKEVLLPIDAPASGESAPPAQSLMDALHRNDVSAAEAQLAPSPPTNSSSAITDAPRMPRWPENRSAACTAILSACMRVSRPTRGATWPASANRPMPLLAPSSVPGKSRATAQNAAAILPIGNRCRSTNTSKPCQPPRRPHCSPSSRKPCAAILQACAADVAVSYGAQGHEPRDAFDLLLRFAISEDGALHGEKQFRTVSEEFAAARPAFRWRHLTGLARVTASEFGRPAAGLAQARELLGLAGHGA